MQIPSLSKKIHARPSAAEDGSEPFMAKMWILLDDNDNPKVYHDLFFVFTVRTQMCCRYFVLFCCFCLKFTTFLSPIAHQMSSLHPHRPITECSRCVHLNSIKLDVIQQSILALGLVFLSYIPSLQRTSTSILNAKP